MLPTAERIGYEISGLELFPVGAIGNVLASPATSAGFRGCRRGFRRCHDLVRVLMTVFVLPPMVERARERIKCGVRSAKCGIESFRRALRVWDCSSGGAGLPIAKLPEIIFTPEL